MTLENSILELAKSVSSLSESLKYNKEEVKATPIVKEEVKATLKTKEEVKATPKTKEEVKATSKPKDEVKAKTKSDVLEDENLDDDLDLDDEENAVYTVTDLKQLAKELIAKGVDRSKVKQTIVQSGGDSISDLSQEGINEAYKLMKKLD